MNKFLLYLKLKELRPAWAVFALTLLYTIAFWSAPSLPIAILLTLSLMGLLIYMAWAGVVMAKTNFSLRIEKNQNAAIVAGFSEGVIAYDQSFRIISMNQAAEAITGVRKDEVVEKVIGPEWSANPRFRILSQIIFPSLAPTVVKKTLGGYPQRVEITLSEPGEMHLEITTNQIFDDTGKILGFLKVVRDRSREVALMRAKSEFISVAAHQMRTPLTGIRWALDTIRHDAERPLAPEQEAMVTQTLSSVEKLIRMIGDFLDVAKIEEGKFGYSLEKGDLAALIREVMETLSQKAESRSVRLILYPPPEPVPYILIDRRKMAIALENLIDNAVTYNVKNGEVRIRIELLKDRPYVQISIEDTGMGIPENEQARLFARFFRGAGAMKVETEGSGLGLYIARNIIRRHGGDIWMKSVEKRGSTLSFILPTDESLVPPMEVATVET